MKKIEYEYKEKYGNISKDEIERMDQLLSSVKSTKKLKDELFPHMRRNLNMEWKSVDFTVYLVPKATPRPRHNISRNIFYVKGAKDNKDIFKKFIKNYDGEIITTPCKFRCISYLPIPSSMNAVEKILAELGLIRPISKPDFDNLAKTYSDMLQGTLLYDDALIVEGISKKFYSTKPRIEIHIEYMLEQDSLYNKKKMLKKEGL